MSKELCGKIATHRFTCFGQNDTFICENHFTQLERVAGPMTMLIQKFSLTNGVQETCKQEVMTNDPHA